MWNLFVQQAMHGPKWGRTKVCKTCGETKLESAFHMRDKGDGRRANCRICEAAKRGSTGARCKS